MNLLKEADGSVIDTVESGPTVKMHSRELGRTELGNEIVEDKYGFI
jgi:hypothetical protein